jgi:hypothetical protein
MHRRPYATCAVRLIGSRTRPADAARIGTDGWLLRTVLGTATITAIAWSRC